MTEQWRPVVGFEGLYEVSDHGRVRSLDRQIVNSLGRKQTCAGRVLKPSRSAQMGYLAVGLHRNGTTRTSTIHLLVLEAFIGPRPTGMQTRHINGDCLDNRLTNLTYGTAAENTADKFKHGTFRTRLEVATHCMSGEHEFTPENTVQVPGGRACRECRRRADREFKRRLREKRLATEEGAA